MWDAGLFDQGGNAEFFELVQRGHRGSPHLRCNATSRRKLKLNEAAGRQKEVMIDREYEIENARKCVSTQEYTKQDWSDSILQGNLKMFENRK